MNNPKPLFISCLCKIEKTDTIKRTDIHTEKSLLDVRIRKVHTGGVGFTSSCTLGDEEGAGDS
jgi:hypothetical protein